MSEIALGQGRCESYVGRPSLEFAQNITAAASYNGSLRGSYLRFSARVRGPPAHGCHRDGMRKPGPDPCPTRETGFPPSPGYPARASGHAMKAPAHATTFLSALPRRKPRLVAKSAILAVPYACAISKKAAWITALRWTRADPTIFLGLISSPPSLALRQREWRRKMREAWGLALAKRCS